MIGLGNEIVRLKYTGTALPLGANTYNLFDSTLQGVGNFLALVGANRCEVTIQNSQALSLKAYWSIDGGVNWNLYDTQAVAIPAAGASSGPFDYLIDPHRDWKVDCLNGGVDQTSFRVELALNCGQRASGV